MSNGEIILYTTGDGQTSIQLRAQEGTVWLTQSQIADLFQITKQNVSLHIKKILHTNELSQSVVKDNLTTAARLSGLIIQLLLAIFKAIIWPVDRSLTE